MLQLQNYKQLEADAETKRRCTIQGKSPVCIRNQLYKIIYGRQAQMVGLSDASIWKTFLFI